MSIGPLFTSQAELAAYCARLGINQEGLGLIRRIRTDPPSRLVRGRRHNVCGDYMSEKMGEVRQFESHTVELGFIYQYEYTASVREYYTQPAPIKLHYRRYGKKIRSYDHTPDMFALQSDHAGWIEDKTEEELVDLEKRFPALYKKVDGKWTCPPGIEFAAQFGLTYEVDSSAELNVYHIRNAEFFQSHYTHPLKLDADKIITARKHLDAHPVLTVQELRQNLADSITIDELNAMIAQSIIYIDWTAAPMAEPETVFVFATRELLETWTATRAKTPILDVAIEVRAGHSIEWDGAIRTILNVGDKQITLDADGGRTIAVPIDEFQHLVQIGSIGRGSDPEANELNEEAQRLLSTAGPTEIARAGQLALEIQAYLDGEQDKPPFYPARTWRDYVRRYKQGLKEFGSGLLGLLRRKRSGNPSPPGSLDTASHEFLLQHVGDHYEQANATDIWNCWTQYKKECKKNKLIAASYETYRRKVESRRGEKQTLRRQGKRAAYAYRPWYWNLDRYTPRHGDQPFQFAHIDHTQIDVQMLRQGKRQNLGRLWWTTMVDAYSRAILAIYITYDPPSYRSCMMVIRECVRRHGRLPQTLVVDNGKEFRSNYFTFLAARCKINIKYRPPAEPRFGSVQERPFGTANKQFFHKVFGNTQLAREIRMVVKSHDPIRLAVWNLPAIIPHLEDWSYNVYANQDHPALGMSPREMLKQGLLQHGQQRHTFIQYNREFVFLTSPTTPKGTAKVIRNGNYFVVNYIKYFSEYLHDASVEGKQVDVRYDPYDVGVAWAYVNGAWVECYSDHYLQLHGKSERLIRQAARRIREQNHRHPQLRRTVNASILADFLTRIDEDEELLQQALRDEESRAQRDNITQCKPSKPRASNQPSQSPSELDVMRHPSYRPTPDELRASLPGCRVF